jgi:flavin reductase
MSKEIEAVGDAGCADEFRKAMRGLAGCVAILTTEDGGRPSGIVVTAVMSLTLSPPALTVAVNQSSSVYPPLLAGRGFCVNLLGRSHADMCGAFVALPPAARFEMGDWARTAEGLPYLRDAQAVVVCDQGPVQDFGTHRLIIGLVKQVVLGDDVDPLMYVGGGYAALSHLAKGA